MFVGINNRFRHLFERVASDEIDDFDLIAEAVDFVAPNIFDNREYSAGTKDSPLGIDAIAFQRDKRLPDMMRRLLAAQNKKANRGIGDEVADHFLDPRFSVKVLPTMAISLRGPIFFIKSILPNVQTATELSFLPT